MAPKLTIYSIDEAVMNIQGMESVMPLEVFGRLVQRFWRIKVSSDNMLFFL